eukprot:g4555.t1
MAASPNAQLFEEVSSKDFLGFKFGSRGYSDQLTSAVAKSGKLCAVKCEERVCVGRDGTSQKVVWLEHNFKFMGGSLGCAEGEVIARGFEHAGEHSLPVIVECRSGGARMQEGTLSLMQLAKTSVCVEKHRSAGLPFISILNDPTYGGVPASYAMQSDVRIGVSGARIGFAGPAVILNTMYEMDQGNFDAECPSDFQSAEYLQAHGQLDIVVPSADDLEAVVADVVAILHGSETSAAAVDSKQIEAKDAVNAAKAAAALDYTASRSMTRPQCQDLIQEIFQNFTELRGDGRVGSDGCIRGGLACLKSDPSVRCVVIASFKGHTPGDMQAANYGMSSPAGYRKALRLMRIAERFGLPVITLVDTCGALPSFSAERDGQSEAIATNLTTMAGLRVPIVTIVAGEGGSGGALGIGMGNVVGMLSTAYYGVISPEGAASILGRYKNDADKAERFPKDCRALAEMQKIYAPQLKDLGVIDEVIWDNENGSSAVDFPELASKITAFIRGSLASLPSKDPEALVAHRFEKFRRMGQYDLLDETERSARVELARSVPAPVRPPRKKPDGSPSKLLQYLATRTISGEHSLYKGKAPSQALASYTPPPDFSGVGVTDRASMPENAKSILDSRGPEALAKWVREQSQSRTLVTDTTLRDAHQSLLATRVRTRDLLGAVPEAARVLHNAFSFEMWGGATFDVSHRFLSEDPWERLRKIREAAPNVCLQMLIRGSNAVGYTSYPDNVVVEFVKATAAAGLDVFRIFDCFNDLNQMKVTIDAVRSVNKVAEVCICFTGDFLDKEKEKIYTLEYYKDLAKKIDEAGAHIIAIKDMAGLLKPGHAAPLMQAIRSVSDKPVHFHTHSTSGVSLSSALAMVAAGCDIIDTAIASMSENTSQPNMNAFVASLQGAPRDTGFNYLELEQLDTYWRKVRVMYAPFENGMNAGSARVFDHQIPGGQYSNLLVQCKSMGLGARWTEVLDMYRDVNKLFGDVIKVTPSSKVVGDLSLYLLNRNMKASDVLERGEEVEFPKSSVDLCAGRLGFPHRGIPEELSRIVLKGEKPMTVRPGELLPPADFEAQQVKLTERLGRPASQTELLSSFLYPKVFDDYCDFLDKNGPVTCLPTLPFWYGMVVGDSFEVTLPDAAARDELLGVAAKEGEEKQSGGNSSLTVVIALKRIGPLKAGKRVLTFTVDGVDRVVTMDDAEEGAGSKTVMADPNDECQVPSPLPGSVEDVACEVGQKFNKGDCMMIVVAMKMEVKVTAPFDLTVESVEVNKGDKVEEGSLVAKVKRA